MSTMDKVLSALKEAVLVNERITQINKAVERIAENQEDLRSRVIRIEALIEYGRSLRQLPGS